MNNIIDCFFLTTAQESNWGFGTLELITLISALATLSAVCVSLYLALKSKTIKFKCRVNNKYLSLQIINTGDAKFSVYSFGIMTNNKYYINRSIRIFKLLSLSIKVSEHKTTSTDIKIGKTLLESGDVVEVLFSGFDEKLLASKKTYLFFMINNKLKRVKINKKLTNIKADLESDFELISKKDLYGSFLFLS